MYIVGIQSISYCFVKCNMLCLLILNMCNYNIFSNNSYNIICILKIQWLLFFASDRLGSVVETFLRMLTGIRHTCPWLVRVRKYSTHYVLCIRKICIVTSFHSIEIFTIFSYWRIKWFEIIFAQDTRIQFFLLKDGIWGNHNLRSYIWWT